MKIGKFGIWFIHAKGTQHEDEIWWVWWWKRSERKKKFMSCGFNSMFKSLKEIDETWDGYIEACAECFND